MDENFFKNGVTEESIKKEIEVSKEFLFNRIEARFFQQKWMEFAFKRGIVIVDSTKIINESQ